MLIIHKIYLFNFFRLDGCFLAFAATKAPSGEASAVSPLNIQAVSVLSVSNIIPIIKNISEKIIAFATPQRTPHNSGSLPLFFLIAINPPKKDDVIRANTERGIMNLCGESQSRVIAEKRTIS